MRSGKAIAAVLAIFFVCNSSFAAVLTTCYGQSNSFYLSSAINDMNGTEPTGVVLVGRGLVSLSGIGLSRETATQVFIGLERYNPAASSGKLNVQFVGCKSEDIN